MGARGPLPKRSGTRVGHISNAESEGLHVTKAPASNHRPTWPAKDPSWHPIAERWYLSLKKSGQSKFYEASDVAYAFFLADQMSYYLEGGPKGRSSMMLTAILSGMTSLLATEGDRRRASLELQHPEENDGPAKAAIDQYREMLQPPKKTG